MNCGGFSESLLESELFGHVHGAFTGAVADKKGLFEIADKGYYQAAKDSREILTGINVMAGKVTYKGVAEAFDLPYTPISELIQ